jgi:hypothetical protein
MAAVDRYGLLLKKTSQQLETLRRFNERMPKGLRIPEFWFDNVETKDDHVQSTNSLVSYLVVKNTPEETLEYNLRLFRLAYPRTKGLGAFRVIISQLTSGKYRSGAINSFTIDLTDNWSPHNGLSIHAAFALKKNLAGIEALAAYVLQDPELIRRQDGNYLPYCNLAGLRLDKSPDSVLGFYWDNDYRRVIIVVSDAKSSSCSFAAPSVIVDSINV